MCNRMTLSWYCRKLNLAEYLEAQRKIIIGVGNSVPDSLVRGLWFTLNSLLDDLAL